MGRLDFHNDEAYKKWVAYVNIHRLNKVPGNQEVYINGKKHKVNHSKR